MNTELQCGTWNITDGIAVARTIEPIAIANGFHTALGGSCLIDGSSNKDLDIILYCHTEFDKDPQWRFTSPQRFIAHLTEIGFEPQTEVKETESACDGRYKQVFRVHYMTRRVDLIFILPITQNEPIQS